MGFVRLLVIAVVGSVWLCRPGTGAEKRAVPAVSRPQSTNFHGWADSLVLAGSAVRAVVVPAAGGRILEYSINGENALAFRPGSLTLSVPGYFLGYQSDLGPHRRGLPSHDRVWAGAWEAKPLGGIGVKLVSERDPQLGIQLEKEIHVEPESGDLGLTQRMRNISQQETAFCLWDRTACPSGGFAFFRLKKKSQFPGRWTLNGKPVDDGQKPESPNVRVTRDTLIARCDGPGFQLGADSDAGWMAYVRGRCLLVKFFPYNSKGRYTDGGHSVTLSFDGQIAELGPLSPEAKLKPGETYEFPEKWTLIELDTRVTSFEDVRPLFHKIPEPPF